MFKIITAPLGLQRCNPEAFFNSLDRIDLTALQDAIKGPERRGPRFKGLDPTIRLYLWGVWRLATSAEDPPTVVGLRRELEDPKSFLAKRCRFGGKTNLPDRKTISNHIRRIDEHPELVCDVLLAINELVKHTPLGKSSSKKKKTQEEANSRKGSEPKNRDGDNVDHRRRRRQEALGDEEFAPIVKDKDTADEFLLNAVHGERPTCHVCPEKRAKGWECTRNHLHGVVVEGNHEPNKPREWKCHCCESKLSITRGTAFHGTHFSSKDILTVLRYMVHFRHGISAQDVAGFLNGDGRNVSEGAVRMLMHRLRECMREDLGERFVGETEIDEMLLRLNNGRMVSILTAYNRTTGRIRFKIIERKDERKPKATKRDMLKFIRETTMPGSIILSDGDAAVPKQNEMGRKHGFVNHKRRQFVAYSDFNGALDKEIDVGTNQVEAKHGFVRRTLRIRNGISRHHLERYLAEAAWRINHLHNQLESENYQGDERRNLSLMRGVLAGATRRKVTLKDLRGEPQQKRDKSSKRTMTAPVHSDDKPEQKTLVPNHPVVPGAQPAENDRAEVKAAQTRPTKKSRPAQESHEKPTTSPMDLSKYVPDVDPKLAEVKPNKRRPSRTGSPVRQSRERDLQKPLPPPQSDSPPGKPVQTGPLEDREQASVA